MDWNRATRSVWIGYAAAILLVVLAVAVRMGFLGALGTRNAFLTFYPAVIVAALFGGFPAGFLATALSAFCVSYWWSEPVGRFSISHSVDWLSIAVFIICCIIISCLAEAVYRARSRAREADEQAGLSAERARAAVALRDSRERLHLALESGRAGTWYWDIITGRPFLDDYTHKLFGLAPGAFPANVEDFFNMLHPDDRERVRGEIAAALSGTADYATTYRVVWPDSSVHFLADRGKVYRDGNGRPVRMTGVNWDCTELRAAQEALRESEEYFRLSFDQSPLGAALTSLDYRLNRVNETYCRMLGYSEEELRSLRFSDIVHPDDLEANVVLQEKVVTGEIDHFRIEMRLIRKDGSMIWVSVFVRLVRDAEGTPIHFMALTEDITERRQAENALRESEKRLALAVDATRLGMFDWNVSNGDILWTRQQEAIFGYPATAGASMLTYRDWADRVHPDDLPRVEKRLERAMAERTFYEKEYRIVWPDGSVHWIDGRGLFYYDADGRAVRMLGTVRDITERKRAEVGLRESEARYRKLFEEATQGIILADAQTGEIVDCNQAFLRLSGYRRRELIGKSQTILHKSEETDPALWQTFSQQCGKEEGPVLSMDLVTRAGVVKQVEIKASLLEIGGRKVLQGFFRDVTSELRLQRERETSLRLLELLDEHHSTHDLVRRLTGFIQSWTGCEAVGVRLRSGDDFPYFETRGFPPEFVYLENSLCLRDDDGKVVRDFQGDPVLECMCGNIIQGRFDPALPFFTSQGSFWTNSTSKLLASTSDADRQTRTRNRCNGEGYESVALIPLRHGGNIYGLLQVNDKQKNRFTPELIEFLERTCVQIATELSQRQSKAELMESERQFRRAILALPFPVIIHAQDGQVIAINEVWTELSGYTIEDIPTISAWTQKACGERHEAVEAEINKLYQIDTRVENGESVITTKSGGIRIWDFSSAPLGMSPDGKHVILSIAKDVTERKEAENALRASEEKFSKAFQHAPLLMTLCRIDDDVYVDVNEQFLRVTGFSREEVIGKAAIALCFISNEERKRLIDILNACGRVGEMALTLRTKDNRQVSCLYQGELITIHNNLFLLSIMQDITERKRAEDERERLEAKLRHAQKLESIGTLAGGIAHDFNNLLAPIVGYTEMALSEIPPRSSMREDLEQVLHASLRARDLVRQILASSRFIQEQQRIPVDISSIVKEALKLLRSSLPTTIEIRQNIRSGMALADATQIHQVFMNLCTNAAHAMNERGVLEVLVSHVDLSESDFQGLLIGDIRPGPYLMLSVSDTGAGMDAHTLERIFDPYFTTKEVGKGSGLELAVVFAIVKRHEGIIGVRSEPGKGTTFSVYLPRMDEEPAEIVQIDDIMPVGDERILLVDDEPAVMEIGTRLLERLGYKVTSQTDSVEALELVRARPADFDLIITDYTMPKLTGLDLAREIRRTLPGIPILLCTGFSEKITGKSLSELRAELLVKPFGMKQLSEAVRKVLDGVHSETL